MNFQFNYQNTAQNDIDIDNIGDVILHVHTILGHEYYLSIVSKLGNTTVLTLGPFQADVINSLNCAVQYKTITYDVKKIQKEIDKFLNTFEIIYAFIEEDPENLNKMLAAFSNSAIDLRVE